MADRDGITLGSKDTTDPLEDSDVESPPTKKTRTVPPRPEAKTLTEAESKAATNQQLDRVRKTDQALAKKPQFKFLRDASHHHTNCLRSPKAKNTFIGKPVKELTKGEETKVWQLHEQAQLKIATAE